jgi:hypothetical protein
MRYYSLCSERFSFSFQSSALSRVTVIAADGAFEKNGTVRYKVGKRKSKEKQSSALFRERSHFSFFPLSEAESSFAAKNKAFFFQSLFFITITEKKSTEKNFNLIFF